jgi:hypothetical protein
MITELLRILHSHRFLSIQGSWEYRYNSPNTDTKPGTVSNSYSSVSPFRTQNFVQLKSHYLHQVNNSITIKIPYVDVNFHSSVFQIASYIFRRGSPYPKKKLNVPAIVFAVLGGVSLIALLIFAVFYFRRRRPIEEDKRISFHRERMVQQRPSDQNNPSFGRVIGPGGTAIPYAFTGPRASLGSTSSHETHRQDIERGLAILPPIMTSLPRNLPGTPGIPLPSGYVVPPPRGPRDRATSVRRVESPRVARANTEPTARQRQLADKLVEVEKRILELKSQPKPLPSTVVRLEDLEIHKTWLVKQRDSMWALEEIDTLPPGYSRYMA